MDSDEIEISDESSVKNNKKVWTEEEDHLILKFVHKNKMQKVKKIFWKNLCLELPERELWEI